MSIPRGIRFDAAVKIIQVSNLAGFRMEHHQLDDLIKYLERHPAMDPDAGLVKAIVAVFRYYPNYSPSTLLLPFISLLLSQWEIDLVPRPVVEARQTEVAVEEAGEIPAGRLIAKGEEEFLPGN